MSKGQTVGYVRVSTADQNTGRQLDGLQLDKVFTDHASGKDTNRPQFQAMRAHVREGDEVERRDQRQVRQPIALVEGEREEPSLRNPAECVAGAADPLQERRDRPRGADLDDEIHLADVDA